MSESNSSETTKPIEASRPARRERVIDHGAMIVIVMTLIILSKMVVVQTYVL